MTTGSYTYRFGWKDDYVYPSLKGVNQLAKEYPDDWFLNNILRMIVHEKMLAEDKSDDPSRWCKIECKDCTIGCRV